MMESGEDCIKLQATDGRLVNLPKSSLVLSETIKELIENVSYDGNLPIPLYIVDYETLERLVSWMICFEKSKGVDFQNDDVKV